MQQEQPPGLNEIATLGKRELMSEELLVLRVFDNEIDAGMAQQVLQVGGITAFVFKDDAGGMEPQLQRTHGVHLVVNRADAEHAHKMLNT